jgi:hypothetical protein
MHVRLLLAFVSTAILGCASERFGLGDADASGGSDAATDAGATADATDASKDKSPFTPSALSSLELWLRADDLSGGDVSTWRDASSRKHDAVVDGISPVCTSPKLIEGPTDSAKRVVAFDGVTACLHLPSGFADFTKGLSLLIAARTHPQTGTTTDGFLRLGTSLDPGSTNTNASMILFGRDNARDLRYVTFNAAGVGSAVNVDGGLSDNAWHLYEVFHDGGMAETPTHAAIRRDGTLVGENMLPMVPPVVSRDSSTIGKGPASNLAVDIAEIILLSKKLDDPERATIEGYLRAKWHLL